jgi:hypothetical protein
LASEPARPALRGRSRVALAPLALSVSGVLFAACGSTTAPPAVVTGPKLAGLGATQREWDTHHQAASGHPASGSSYGPSVPFSGGTIDQFTAVTVADDRIVGWTMAFPDGTSIASAEQQVRAQLPSDSRQTASRRGTYPHSTNTCEIVSFESRSLGLVLGSRRGTAGVMLHQVSVTGQGSPSIAVVDRATVRVPALPDTAGC